MSEYSVLLERLKSDYIPEHIAAANDFINAGYSAAQLKNEIDKEQNPHWVSMYLYICSKQGLARQAWEYVQYRVESEYNLFSTVDIPNILDLKLDESQYLLNAARKWLITKELLGDFISHMSDINKKLANYRLSLICSVINVNEENAQILGGCDEKSKMLEDISKILKSETLIYRQYSNYDINNLNIQQLMFTSQITTWSFAYNVTVKSRRAFSDLSIRVRLVPKVCNRVGWTQGV